jgi:hypothetical protein
MSSLGIQTALDNAIIAFQAANAQFELALENTPYTPTKGVMYLSTAISGLNRRKIALGPQAVSVAEYMGYYQVSVNGAIDEGMATLRAAGDTVAAAFPSGLVLIGSDGTRVIIQIASPQSAIENGDWVTVPVAIQWFSTDP